MYWKLRVVAGLAMAQIFSITTESAYAQWYLNPQAGGNGAMNTPLYGTSGLVNGSGIVPGSGGLLPGNGAASGIPATSTGGSDSSGDGGASSAGGGGYQFTSDPISAYTNAMYSGMANLVRAEGQYNQQTTKSMINYEQARTLYLENRQRLFDVRRSLYRAQLAAKAEDAENQHLALLRSEAFLAAHRPLPLPSSQLHPDTGGIQWPTVLMAPEFDDLRKDAEGLFEKRATKGSVPEIDNHIKIDIREMKQLLLKEVVNIPLEDYSEARQFLDRLGASAH